MRREEAGALLFNAPGCLISSWGALFQCSWLPHLFLGHHKCRMDVRKKNCMPLKGGGGVSVLCQELLLSRRPVIVRTTCSFSFSNVLALARCEVTR